MMNKCKNAVITLLFVVISVLTFTGINVYGEEKTKWTESFIEDKQDFLSVGKNPYFILEPGYYLVLKNKRVTLTITVLNETKKIDTVETRIVEEREETDTGLLEVSRNYYAISKKTNSIFYFGESVDEYKSGKIVSHGGEWQSGVNGAKFGLMIPGTVLVGARYYQEIAPKTAMDRAEIVSISETMDIAAGKFENCLKTEETTPLEPKDKGYKFYALGIGLMKDGDLLLVKYGYLEK